MNSNNWNEIISKLPNPHFLQTYEWGQVKAKYGWEPIYLVWTEKQFSVIPHGDDVSNQSDNSSLITDNCIAACLVLKRTILRNAFAARMSILYAPKGPLLDWEDESLRKRVFDDLQSFAKKQGAIFLKIDPDIILGHGIVTSEENESGNSEQIIPSEMKRRGWVESKEQIQFKNTVILDLFETEEMMLARMKQKTRYNIRLAEKKGVSVRVDTLTDLENLYRMYAETSMRDGFVIRDENYYMTVWKTFMSSNEPRAIPLIAEVDHEPVAAIFLFMFAGRAYYVYGMSRAVHREKMPTYLLQWEAMKVAKQNGCLTYDLWGAPDVFDESDSMWGVYRFKEGLGGEVMRTVGAYDFAANKILYKLYADIMPRVLDVMRSRRMNRMNSEVEE